MGIHNLLILIIKNDYYNNLIFKKGNRNQTAVRN